MSASPFLDTALPLPAPPEARYIWAVVTQVGPLRIQVDGDSSPLGITPDTLVAGLKAGQRVYCQIVNRRLVVLGVSWGASDVAAVSNPNLVRNPAFRLNSRGYVSGTYQVGGSVHFDGWKHTYHNDTKLTFTAAPQGQLVTIGYRAPSTFGLISQRIERANITPGTHTLSWAGTAAARVANVSAVPSATFANSPLTVTLDGTEDVEIQIITNSGLPSTVGNVKLERGSVATPFVLPPIDEDRRACQRYFQVINLAQGVPLSYGFQISTTQGYSEIHLPVQMRATPSFIQIGDLFWSDRVSFNTGALSLVGLFGWGTTLTLVHNWVTALGAASRPGQVYNHTAAMQILLDAEL